jgi:TetR/AcrR family transcriptional regulator
MTTTPHTPPATRSASTSADTRERILDAAERLFAEQGFAATSVRDLSKAVGLTPASLYNHFEGKQALYEAVMERGVQPLLALLESLPRIDAAGEPDDMVEAIMSHLAAHPYFPRLIQHEAVTGGVLLERIVREWIGPLIDRAVATMEAHEQSDWKGEEVTMLMVVFLQLIFGHFAMAPMIQHVFDDDPLSAEFLERQTRFFRKLVHTLINNDR